jgi:subtilisin family serine protease
MNRDWLLRRLRNRRQPPTNQRQRHSALYLRRLALEPLENRRLLTASDGTAPQLTLDASAAPTSLLVQYRDIGAYASSLAAYQAGTNSADQWDIAPGTREVNLNAGVDLASALAAFQSDANVLFAEPNYPVQLDTLIPNDTQFGDQWDLKNTGQMSGFADCDIKATDAWNATLGSSSVVVAVIDTGVDYDHPDLYQNIWLNQNEIPASRRANLVDTDGDGLITFRDLNDAQNQGDFKITDVNGDHRIDGADILAPMAKDAEGRDLGTGGWADGVDTDRNGYVDDLDGYDFANRDKDPMDDYFHGTHVAGTIAAMMNNHDGIAGIAPNSLIMPLKFLDAKGFGVTSDAIAALNYAVANGASISNNSWGGGGASELFEQALVNAQAHNHIFVAAAGNLSQNNDTTPYYPASSTNPNVISVAATDRGDYIAYFSNKGATSVDLGAPGVDILSTLPTIETPGMEDQGLVPNYGTLDGTSMAAPHVAGVVALLKAYHPEWSAQTIIQQVLGTVDPVPSLHGVTVSGGRLDAAAALGQASDTTSPHMVQFAPSGILTGPIDHVHLTFSEIIDLATFDSNDLVSFTGPDGEPIGILGVSPAGGNGREFNVNFTPQSARGDYTLVLGPHIADIVGNELDQNGNRIGGEDPDDDVTITFSIVTSFVFTSTDVPIYFSDLDAVSSFITIDQDLPIDDVNVGLNLSFPQDGNLSIWLISPAQTVVELSNQNGGVDPDFLDTIFDDEADTAISSGSPPFTGSFRPDEVLAALQRQNARGVWQLFVKNVSDTPDFGSINGWSLDITRAQDAGCCNSNKPPVPKDDLVTGIQNTPLGMFGSALLANDTDPEGNKLTIVSVLNAFGGTATLKSNGNITFLPGLGLSQGGFDYVVSDGQTTASAHVAVTLLPQYPLHNTINGNDVNNDSHVVAYDALLIINWLNAFGSTEIHRSGAQATPDLFYDTRADNFIAPSDALTVINYINAHPNQPNFIARNHAEGEPAETGNTSVPADDLPLPPADEQSTALHQQIAHADFVLLAGAPRSACDVASTPSPTALPPDDVRLDPGAVDQCLEVGEPDSSADGLRLLWPADYSGLSDSPRAMAGASIALTTAASTSRPGSSTICPLALAASAV